MKRTSSATTMDDDDDVDSDGYSTRTELSDYQRLLNSADLLLVLDDQQLKDNQKSSDEFSNYSEGEAGDDERSDVDEKTHGSRSVRIPKKKEERKQRSESAKEVKVTEGNKQKCPKSAPQRTRTTNETIRTSDSAQKNDPKSVKELTNSEPGNRQKTRQSAPPRAQTIHETVRTSDSTAQKNAPKSSRFSTEDYQERTQKRGSGVENRDSGRASLPNQSLDVAPGKTAGRNSSKPLRYRGEARKGTDTALAGRQPLLQDGAEKNRRVEEDNEDRDSGVTSAGYTRRSSLQSPCFLAAESAVRRKECWTRRKSYVEEDAVCHKETEMVKTKRPSYSADHRKRRSVGTTEHDARMSQNRPRSSSGEGPRKSHSAGGRESDAGKQKSAQSSSRRNDPDKRQSGSLVSRKTAGRETPRQRSRVPEGHSEQGRKHEEGKHAEILFGRPPGHRSLSKVPPLRHTSSAASTCANPNLPGTSRAGVKNKSNVGGEYKQSHHTLPGSSSDWHGLARPSTTSVPRSSLSGSRSAWNGWAHPKSVPLSGPPNNLASCINNGLKLEATRGSPSASSQPRNGRDRMPASAKRTRSSPSAKRAAAWPCLSLDKNRNAQEDNSDGTEEDGHREDSKGPAGEESAILEKDEERQLPASLKRDSPGRKSGGHLRVPKPTPRRGSVRKPGKVKLSDSRHVPLQEKKSKLRQNTGPRRKSVGKVPHKDSRSKVNDVSERKVILIDPIPDPATVLAGGGGGTDTTEADSPRKENDATVTALSSQQTSSPQGESTEVSTGNSSCSQDSLEETESEALMSSPVEPTSPLPSILKTTRSSRLTNQWSVDSPDQEESGRKRSGSDPDGRLQWNPSIEITPLVHHDALSVPRKQDVQAPSSDSSLDYDSSESVCKLSEVDSGNSLSPVKPVALPAVREPDRKTDGASQLERTKSSEETTLSSS